MFQLKNTIESSLPTSLHAHLHSRAANPCEEKITASTFFSRGLDRCVRLFHSMQKNRYILPSTFSNVL